MTHSDKPVLERLQVKRDRRFAALHVPSNLTHALEPGSSQAALEDADVVLLFVADRRTLEQRLPETWQAAPASAILWIAYPKLTSAMAGDLNRDVLHDLLPAHGLTVVSQIAIDQDWSAMRLKRID